LLGGGRGGRGSRGATAVGGLAGGDGAPPRSGGALGPCRGPLREGDAQLLAGTVPLLGGGGPAADQQRPGAVVRQLSLPREASQRSQGSITQSGVRGERRQRKSPPQRHAGPGGSRETSWAAQVVPQLRLRYAAVFGETTNANNRTWLVKKIAWRRQALAEGDLSERARQRAAELAHDADLRANPPKTIPMPISCSKPSARNCTCSTAPL